MTTNLHGVTVTFTSAEANAALSMLSLRTPLIGEKERALNRARRKLEAQMSATTEEANR